MASNLKMALSSLKPCLGHRALKLFCPNYRIVVFTTRSNHTRRFLNGSTAAYFLQRVPPNKKYYEVLSIASVRWASQIADTLAVPAAASEVKAPIFIDESTLPPIPTPPVPPETPVESLADAVSALEPPLSSYGLAGWSPVGIIQQGLEFFHVTLGMPWWGSIVMGTLILRMLVFPLVIKSQRNAAKMTNNMPEMQRLQEKMTEARHSGNSFEAARISQELMLFMKEKNMNPMANMWPPLLQAPLFISMFLGLRGMANLPVESLRTGGMLWFVDLTVPDQYYLLPIITSTTLFITIEVGTDSVRASSLGMIRYVLRCIPLIIFPFTMNFPGAVLCYWVSTNFISLIQTGILKIPKVRKYFNIEEIIVDPKQLPGNKKGFVQGFKDSMTNLKITRQLNERERADFVSFKHAGKAPVVRTFKYDPTKPRPQTTPELLSKKKEQ